MPTSLAQTSKIISRLTKERSIWMTLLNVKQKELPFPIGAREMDDITGFTSSQLEHLVLSAETVSRKWLQPRAEQPLRRKPYQFGEAIILFEVVLERYLLCAYAEGFLSLWDIGVPFSCSAGQLTWMGVVKTEDASSWSSAALVEDVDSVYVAVTKTGG